MHDEQGAGSQHLVRKALDVMEMFSNYRLDFIDRYRHPCMHVWLIVEYTEL